MLKQVFDEFDQELEHFFQKDENNRTKSKKKYT